VNLSNKSLVVIFPIFVLLALIGLSYLGVIDGRNIVGGAGWTPAGSLVLVTTTSTPTPGWWNNLPAKPVIQIPGTHATPTITITPTSKGTATKP
jgi:hypothetical protein